MERPATLRDWLFAGRGKRLLLEALLLAPASRTWTRTELARASDQHPKARMDTYLEPMVRIGLLVAEEGRYRLRADHALVPPLRGLLRTLQAVPDDGEA